MSPKFHYPVHKGPQIVPILSHKHPIHTFPFYFFYLYFNIISQSTPRSFKWSFSFRFPHQKSACISLFTSYLSHTPTISYICPSQGQLVTCLIFTVVPCILMLSSLLLVQLMHNKFALKY